MYYRNFEYANTGTYSMWSESFHNVLKTYCMKRKPNKRVDDLINVLLTYEEDTYWRYKQQNIYQHNISVLTISQGIQEE